MAKCFVLAGVALIGCGDDGDAQPAGSPTEVVAAAEAKTLSAASVRVSASFHELGDRDRKTSYSALWQAPDRAREEESGKTRVIAVANRTYLAIDGEVDRYDLVVTPTRPDQAGKISNFPVPTIGDIAQRAKTLTYDGTNYTATVDGFNKPYTATIRIADGYIVWLRILTADTDGIYELFGFNDPTRIDEPSADKVDTSGAPRPVR
jgi:hypothetical protein